MSHTNCVPLSMCGLDFNLYHLVNMTWHHCVGVIFIYFLLSQTWLDGQLTVEFVGPWCSVFIKTAEAI